MCGCPRTCFAPPGPAAGAAWGDVGDNIGFTGLFLALVQAIRFSTLTVLCEALNCQPGDLFRVRP